MNIKKKAVVESIMTRQPICVNISNSLLDVEEIMNTHCIRHVPVVSENQLVV